MQDNAAARSAELVRGEFVSDGKSFVFRLEGTPVSGAGSTAEEAFQNLMRATAAAGELGGTLRDLAREQQGERFRATLVRAVMACLIVFGVVGGALGASAALAPRVAADMVEVAADRLGSWLQEMPADERAQLASHVSHLVALGCSGTMAAPPAGGQ